MTQIFLPQTFTIVATIGAASAAEQGGYHFPVWGWCLVGAVAVAGISWLTRYRPKLTPNGDLLFERGRAARRAGLSFNSCTEPPGDGRGLWALGWNAEDRSKRMS